MKRLLIALMVATFAACLCGCATAPDRPKYGAKSVQRDFNHENYVWESFLFPTNRTDR